MSQTVTDILEQVNAELVAAISRFQPERTRASAILPEEVAALRKEIHGAANCLRELPRATPKDPSLEKNLTVFRRNLEQLQLVLPGLHARLSTEQARLSEAQVQCSNAAAWIHASRKTL
jgi:hypothetical protein